MRKNRRRGRSIGARLAAAARFSVGAVAGGIATLGALRVAAATADHPYFAVREIEVDGGRDTSAVLAWAGVEPGASLWHVAAAATEERLLSQPRIRSAVVRREFPDRLRITVEERRPVAVWLLAEPLFVDADGVAFAPLARESLAGLPCITGLRREDAARAGWLAERLREAARVVVLWSARAGWPDLSELRVDRNGDVVVFPERPAIAVRFPRGADEEPFSRLAAVLDVWRGREGRVAAVDLSVPGLAIVRTKTAERRAPAARRQVGV
jgi:cell division protein FtsQ